MKTNEVTGLEVARLETTAKLLWVASETKKQKASREDKFAKVFPELDYNYSHVSSVLNERGYHVQWASDNLINEYQELKNRYDALARKLGEKDREINSLKNDRKEEAEKEMIWIGKSRKVGKSVYLSLPVSKEVADRWNRKFGVLSCKQPLGNAVLTRFMDRVDNKEIRFMI